MPQLAWHLAWHIVARPRPLPARSNVAVDKPIKKPLLNALSLCSSSTPYSTGPGGMPATRRNGRGEERRDIQTGRKGKQDGRHTEVCLGYLTSKFNDKTFVSVTVQETKSDGEDRL